ncbi:TPA: transposase [Enterococcus faecalis]
MKKRSNVEQPYTVVENQLSRQFSSDFQLIPRVFLEAKLVIDCFHVVQHLNRAFNTMWIKEVARLRKEN